MSFKWFLLNLKVIDEMNVNYHDFVWLPSLVVDETKFEKIEQSSELNTKKSGKLSYHIFIFFVL